MGGGTRPAPESRPGDAALTFSIKSSASLKDNFAAAAAILCVVPCEHAPASEGGVP